MQIWVTLENNSFEKILQAEIIAEGKERLNRMHNRKKKDVEKESKFSSPVTELRTV